MTREEIRSVLERYLAAHPDRDSDVLPLAEALDTPHDVTSRTTYPLHVTCSSAAIDATGRVLMIHHRALNRWLLPGGHVEPGDRSLYGAALRELEEETAIPWQHAVSPPTHDVIPVDIDVHEIPANAAKQEPAHLHADFRFAFWAKDSEISIQPDEVIAFAWRPPADLPTPRLAAGVAAV
ncbi:NUDIX hydrolase [Nonomuraea candida]|uniref:NUDIX hydrolase n=1 Tax=Nonomuraea candida TaxID=359159 RepID=UPI000AFF21AB|nr:NUDIX domain-containing protein [Nonomuraea candida]